MIKFNNIYIGKLIIDNNINDDEFVICRKINDKKMLDLTTMKEYPRISYKVNNGIISYQRKSIKIIGCLDEFIDINNDKPKIKELTIKRSI